MRILRNIRQGSLALAAAAMLAVMTAGTAGAATGSPAAAVHNPATARLADEAGCTVLFTSCKTGSIRSNPIYHYITYQMCSSPVRAADWQVKDADNGVIVGQGHIPRNVCLVGTIRGLYGAYWGWVFNTAPRASAFIDNL